MNVANRAPEVLFLLLATLIGVLAGVGALAFLAFIAVGQWALWPGGGVHFLGQVMLAPWWLKLLIPTLGGLAVGPVIAFWAPEIGGTGVPEVMAVVALPEGQIPPRLAVLRAWCTGVTILTGGSVGREGPVVAIGAAIGSFVGRLFGCNQEQARICLACGAAAGIAATFNAPLAGTLFAVEIILAELEVFYLGHILIAALGAVILSQRLLPFFPVFTITEFHFNHLGEIGLYCLLGVLAGLLAIAFTRSTYATDAWFRRWSLPAWLKPGIGGLCLGGVGIVAPYVLGVGYDAINLSLAGKFVLAGALFILAAKFLATVLCLGSGMSGGIMGPSLVMGAMLGTGLAAAANLLFPGLNLYPSDYAIIGMGAVLSGTTLGPITAMLIIFESATTHRVVLPLVVSCMASLLTVRYLYGYSTYEAKLVARGLRLIRGHEIHILQSLKVKDHVTREMEVIFDDTPLPEILQKAEQSPHPLFVVLNRQEELSGVITLWDLRRLLWAPKKLSRRLTARDLKTANVVAISLEDNFQAAIKVLEGQRFSFLPVVLPPEGKKVVGVLRREDVLTAYYQQLIRERML
jgi:CIC family chloride channel protein